MRIAAALLLGGLATAGLWAQAPERDLQRVAASGTARIAGSVVADDQARGPIRRATLTLLRAGTNDSRIIASDDRGQFQFDQLPAGFYTMTASKGGYLTINYGAPQPGMPGSPIPLAEGQRFEASPILVTRGAVVTGRFLDARGQPIPFINVQATQFRLRNNERVRRNLPGASGSASTDEHGTYRIFGLLPGEYVVSTTSLLGLGGQPRLEATAAELQWARQPAVSASAAEPARGRPFTYAPTYYPGTTNPLEAQVIQLAKGEERAGMDFRQQIVPVAHVTGSVTGPDGQPAQNASVVRVFRQKFPLLTQWGLAGIDRTAPDGTFSIGMATPPGEYTIFVRAAPTGTGPATGRGAPPQALTLWGAADILVNGDDVSDVAIRLREGMSVSGQVVFEAATGQPPVDLKALQLRLTPSADLPGTYTLAPAAVGADRTFRFDGAGPGPYRLSLAAGIPGAPARWGIKSAIVNGRNVLDLPLEVRPGEDVTGLVVTLSDQVTELTGTLVDASGQATPQFYLLAYPVDRTYWIPDSRWIKFSRADVRGAYTLTGLPAGDYYLCALTELDPSLQYEPDLLDQFVPASIKVTLKDGERRTQTLRVGR